MNRTFLAWITILVGTSSASCLAAVPGSWQELLDTASVPCIKPWRTRQASGYDRLGGYFDSGNFLRTEPNGRHILLDAKGPGVIDRMWFTYKGEFRSEPYDLLVYLDGQTEPVIHVNLDELFLGSHSPFVMPVAGLCGNPKFPGRFSFVPIGFRSSCLVVLQPTADAEKYRTRQNSAGETIPHVYYQMTWRQLPEGAQVQPFAWEMTEAEQHAFEQVIDRWSELGTPAADQPTEVDHRQLELVVPSRSRAVVADLTGSGTVTGIRIRASSLSHLQLKCYWDGNPQAAVSAPCETFFGGAEDGGAGRTRSLWIGRLGAAWYCYLPMPYRNGARLVLESGADENVTVQCELDVADAVPAADCAYFHATRYDYPSPTQGHDYVVLDVTGRGHFAGLVMDRPGHMEGDDRFYVDDEIEPSIHGTGTEDFFNFAWGLSHTGSLAQHGIVPEASGPVGYRFHLPAGVPFTKRLRITWEHGHDLDQGPNLDARRYSGLVFYYLQ